MRSSQSVRSFPARCPWTGRKRPVCVLLAPLIVHETCARPASTRALWEGHSNNLYLPSTPCSTLHPPSRALGKPYLGPPEPSLSQGSLRVPVWRCAFRAGRHLGLLAAPSRKTGSGVFSKKISLGTSSGRLLCEWPREAVLAFSGRKILVLLMNSCYFVAGERTMLSGLPFNWA